MPTTAPCSHSSCPSPRSLEILRERGAYDAFEGRWLGRTLTGNKYEIKTEYHGTGAFPLDLTWTYNSSGGSSSDTSADSILGANRTHSYQRRVFGVTAYGITTASITRPEGNTLTFNRSGANWVPDSNLDGILTSTRDVNDVVTSWSYRNAKNETELYDAAGTLQSLTDANGNAQVLTYDASGHIASVTDMTGRQLLFTYNANNRLSQLTTPDGSILQFSYDASDNLQTVTYPGGASATYLYNEQAYTSGAVLPHALTGEQDANGARSSTTSYDSQGRATGTFLGSNVDSYSAQYTSSADGSYVATAAVTSPLGKIRTLNFTKINSRVVSTGYADSCAGCTSKTQAFSYDSSGHNWATTDALGVTTYYTYDPNGLEIERVEAATTYLQRTIQTDWNTALRKPTERRVLDTSGTLVSKTDWTYNTRGQVLTQTQVDPVTAATRTTTRTYCEAADIAAGVCPLLGLLKSVDGARTDASDLTTYTYYQTDDATCATSPTTCPHRKGDLWKITDALGHITQFLQYDGAGRALSTQDPNGVITDLTYNSRGWLTQQAVRGAVATDDHITSFAHDANGQITQITQPDNSYVAFTYDAAHRLTDVRDALNNNIHYTLDAAGNRIKEDTKAALVLTRTLSRVYDGMGMLLQTLNAQNAATQYTYDANNNPNLTTDALGRVTRQYYDPLNRLFLTENDLGGIDARTSISHDLLDHVIQVTGKNSNIKTFYQYDGLDNLTKLTSPDTGITNYTYDAAGNRKSQTDARNVLTNYSYDVLNRLTSITYPTTALNTSFVYDTTQTACAIGETFSLGRLTKFTDGSGNTVLCYDRFGNLVRKQQITNGKTLTTRYVYDKAGRVLQTITPTATTITNTRDAAGRILTLAYRLSGQTQDIPVISNVTWYPFGPVQQLTYANGRTLTRTYDLDYVIGSVLSNGPGGLDYSFGRDAVGNLTQLLSSAASNNFSYDGLDRLTGVKALNNSLIAAYMIDDSGDRLSKQTPSGTQTYVYPTTNHHLSSVAGTARTYDAAGNTATIGKNQTAFVYADTGRMVSLLIKNKVTKQYAYNARGERVRKYLGTVTGAYYSYDESGHLMGDYDTNAARLNDYLWLDDLPVGVLTGGTGKLAYIEPDHLGTPRVAVDPARNVAIWKWPLANDAFGESAPQQDPDGDGTQFVLNLRLLGQYFDAESGLSYNYFRDYESVTGRYVESDPIGVRAGINTYGYVGSDPLKFLDPRGLRRVLVFEQTEGEQVYGYDKVFGCEPGECGNYYENSALKWTAEASDGCIFDRAIYEVFNGSFYFQPAGFGSHQVNSTKYLYKSKSNCTKCTLADYKVEHEWFSPPKTDWDDPGTLYDPSGLKP